MISFVLGLFHVPVGCVKKAHFKGTLGCLQVVHDNDLGQTLLDFGLFSELVTILIDEENATGSDIIPDSYPVVGVARHALLPLLHTLYDTINLLSVILTHICY